MTIPFWIYLVAGGALISAFMAIKTGKDERKIEMESIEKEGEVYMERLVKEREGRQRAYE